MMTLAQIRALKELLPIIALIVIILGFIGGAIYSINVTNQEPTPVNVQITHEEPSRGLQIDYDIDYDIEINNKGKFIPPGHRK